MVPEIDLNEQRVGNALQILAENVTVVSPSGTLYGRDHYIDRIAIYKGWKNAHRVKTFTVTVPSPDTYGLEAQILYENIRPNGEKYTTRNRYVAVLKSNNSQDPLDLPVFEKIELFPKLIEQVPFEDAYYENRAKSFLHRWLLLMEITAAPVDRFDALLATQFSLDLSLPERYFNLWFRISR